MNNAMDKCALISVNDKAGIVEQARVLHEELGFEIISTSNTAIAIRSAGIPVTDVSEVTRHPEILGGRVKTLHPAIHAGLLARADNEVHVAVMQALGYKFFQVLFVDLYPFQKKAASGASDEEIIENIDIGGPGMLRAFAKNCGLVACSLADRLQIIARLREGTADDPAFRRELMGNVFTYTAAYDLAIATYVTGGKVRGVIGRHVRDLKYGENAWQAPAAMYRVGNDPLGLDTFHVAGEDSLDAVACKKAMLGLVSWFDVNRLVQTLTHIVAGLDVNGLSWGHGCVAAVNKHGNDVGATAAGTPKKALRRVLSGDPKAEFGGVLMVNFPIGDEEAEYIRHWLPKNARKAGQLANEGKRFLTAVVAPAFTPTARHALSKGSKRLLITNPNLGSLTKDSLDQAQLFVPGRNVFVCQPNYTFVLNLEDPAVKVYGGALNNRLREDIVLGWAIGSTSNSNTVVLTVDGKLVGRGIGQQDRVGACELAINLARRALHDPRGTVAYSDSFFPFDDGPRLLAQAGVSCIFASSGSKGDEDVIAACRELGVTLVMMPDGMCRGFFGH